MTDEPKKDIHTQLYEISHSWVMAFNPTDEDFVVEWSKSGIHQYGGGGQTGEPYKPWLIPNSKKDIGYGNGKVEVPYYIGWKYYNEMSDKLFNAEVDKYAGIQRKKFKGDPAMWGTWWEQNWRAYVDRDAMKERLKKVLILGITKKYSEPIPGIEPYKPKRDDTIEQFENMQQYTPDEQQTIEENKASLIQEVAQ